MKTVFPPVFLLVIAFSVVNPPFFHSSQDSRDVNLTVERAFSLVDNVLVAMGLTVEEKRPTQGSALVIAMGKKSKSMEQTSQARVDRRPRHTLSLLLNRGLPTH
jgi:hypothetical protein